MNYYEEFGLAPRATPEKIHQSYRSLSRLLHPDQQADETLRRLAETQMKRVNAMHEVLADPARRRNYDLSLTAAAGAPQSRRLAAWSRGRGLWLVVGIAAAGAFWWHLRDASAYIPARSAAPPAGWAKPAAPAPTPAPEVAARPPRRGAGASELSEQRRELALISAERDEARAEVARLAAVAPENVPAPTVNSAEETPAPATRPAPAAPAVTEPVRNPADQGHSFAGTWFYVRPRIAPGTKALYPPDYIEAVILEEDGALRGRYRARYQVTDRAISPEVVFRFEGKAGRDTAVLPWSGAGGATGEVTLQLTGENSMDVKWTAYDLGAQMGLASGTAVLIRRRDP